MIYFIISTIHFSILYYYLYNTTHIHIHTRICTDVHIRYVLFSCMLNTCIQNTHITLFCHVVVVVVFFIVVFIEMTILYTMIIVNSHLLHHFIPEPMIQELHILWFDFYVFLIWFDFWLDGMGFVCLFDDRQIWYHQIMISGYRPFTHIT